MTMFSATFSAVAVTAQQDLFELVAPTAGAVCVHRVLVSQSSDVGDAQEEGLNVLLRRGQTTTGSGGTTVTPADMGTSDATYPAGGAVKANNTTKASGGTIATLHAEAWNVRGPWEWLPTPETRIWLRSAQRLTVELATTPADALTVSGTLLYELV